MIPKTQTIFLILLLIYILGFALHASLLNKTVYGDGVFYYSWVRSAVVDGDIDFTNEYKTFNVTQPIMNTGLPGNKYSIGAGVLWYPWFLWAHTLIRKTGYESQYQIVIGLVSVLYAFTGLILLFGTLRKFFSEHASQLTCIAVALCSNLFFYGSLDSVNSHAVSFFSAALFLTVLLEKNVRWFQVGCVVGLVALIRNQDMILGLAAVSLLKPKYIPVFFAGILYIFTAQLLVWQILNDTFLKSPYISTIEGFRFTDPHVLGVLFSPQNGLFLWTPITLIGVIGLWIKKQNRIFLGFLIVFIFQLLLVATWSIWWQGASYSGRMFVSSLPLLAFGIAGVFEHLLKKNLTVQQICISIIFPLGFINASLMVYFLLSH